MKYIAILDTDEFKDFKFFEDADGKYLAVKDANSKSNEWLPLHFKALDSYGECFECMMRQYVGTLNYCPNCGAKMEV